MRIFDTGMGCRIAYDVYGTHGETVILMHGGFGTGHSHFANEIPLLAHHHIVYVVDFPGYGQSAPPSREVFGNAGLGAVAFGSLSDSVVRK